MKVGNRNPPFSFLCLRAFVSAPPLDDKLSYNTVVRPSCLALSLLSLSHDSPQDFLDDCSRVFSRVLALSEIRPEFSSSFFPNSPLCPHRFGSLQYTFSLASRGIILKVLLTRMLGALSCQQIPNKKVKTAPYPPAPHLVAHSRFRQPVIRITSSYISPCSNLSNKLGYWMPGMYQTEQLK